MAKTVAPLLSFGASGQIGKTMVFSSWRGVPYSRKHVVPANPNSQSQQGVRGVFKWLNATWKLLAPDAQAPWEANAAGRPYTDRNQYISKNASTLRDEATVDSIIGSPGALGGTAPAAMTLTPSSGEVSVGLTAPTLPTDWTISKAVATAYAAQDPSSDVDYVTVTASASASPWTVDITDLDAGDYVVTAWFVYSRPDGKVAYGPSLTDTATVT